MVTTSYRKETVGSKVAHQDQIHQASEDKPRIVLDGGFVEGVVGVDLGFELSFEEVVQLRVRFLPVVGLTKILVFSAHRIMVLWCD